MQDIKITRAGYLYVNGDRMSKQIITPLQIPTEYGPRVEEFCRKWAFRHYAMGDPNIGKPGYINSMVPSKGMF